MWTHFSFSEPPLWFDWMEQHDLVRAVDRIDPANSPNSASLTPQPPHLQLPVWTPTPIFRLPAPHYLLGSCSGTYLDQFAKKLYWGQTIFPNQLRKKAKQSLKYCINPNVPWIYNLEQTPCDLC